MGEETCSEQIRLLVKNTFMHFQCLDDKSPKLTRYHSDPCLPSLAPPRDPALSDDLSAKCMEAPTPTTCCSVDSQHSSRPSWDLSDTGECGNGSRSTGVAELGCNLSLVPAPSPPLPSNFVDRDTCHDYQAMTSSPARCAAATVLSTSPKAVPAQGDGSSTRVALGMPGEDCSSSADGDLDS